MAYALNAHDPLHLAVIHLGTNDLKFTDAKGSVEGMRVLVRQILEADRLYPLSRAWLHFPQGAKVLIVPPA